MSSKNVLSFKQKIHFGLYGCYGPWTLISVLVSHLPVIALYPASAFPKSAIRPLWRMPDTHFVWLNCSLSFKHFIAMVQNYSKTVLCNGRLAASSAAFQLENSMKHLQRKNIYWNAVLWTQNLIDFTRWTPALKLESISANLKSAVLKTLLYPLYNLRHYPLLCHVFQI